ncbi:hypothetical protein NKG94_15815 [Micromonospora sp. M12]
MFGTAIGGTDCPSGTHTLSFDLLGRRELAPTRRVPYPMAFEAPWAFIDITQSPSWPWSARTGRVDGFVKRKAGRVLKRSLLALATSIVLPLSVVAVPSAALAAGCVNTGYIEMRFASSSPWRYGYSSSSGVAGYAYSDYTYMMDGRCTSAAGLLWYRRAADPVVVYIYSAHRIN